MGFVCLGIGYLILSRKPSAGLIDQVVPWTIHARHWTMIHVDKQGWQRLLREHGQKGNRRPHQKCSETWHQRAKSNQRDFSCLQSFRFPAESLRMCLAELLLLKSSSVAPRRLTRRPSTSGVNTELLCCGGATSADAARLPRHESSVTIAPGRRRRDFPVGREVEYSSRGPGPDPSTTIRPRLFSSAA